MNRLIQTKIKEPLAEELLFGASLAAGGEVASASRATNSRSTSRAP
jgi:hypothetical protein